MINPTIRFIIPYFGRWPFWFDFFLESCRRNSSIDWLIFTDCEIPSGAPENVSFTRIDYLDYCGLVSSRLGIKFQPENPYKLCDIKPALGAIHEDDIKGYDFWAFGDIDVVYGDLRDYFTAERLSRKDLFSTHARRISGHLCLMRNTSLMRNAFRHIPNWQKRYEDQQHHALDEGAFSRLFIRHKNWPERLRLWVAHFNAWSRRSEFVEAHSTYTLQADGSRVVADTWFYKDGFLTNSDLGAQKLPYLHFMVWKNKAWKGFPPHMLLGPAGLHAANAWCVDAGGWHAMPDGRG